MNREKVIELAAKADSGFGTTYTNLDALQRFADLVEAEVQLRDEFAARAMQSLIANNWSVSLAPSVAYDYADAMMKARDAK